MGARRWLAGLALLGAAVAGCTGDDDGEKAQPTVPVEETTAPTTTAARPTPTTLDVAALDTSSENWDVVVRNLVSIRHQAYVRRDPALIDFISEPTCPCNRMDKDEINRMLSTRERSADDGVEVVRVEKVPGEVGPGYVVVRLVDRSGPQFVMDASGSVRRVGDGWPPTRRILYMHKTDGRWRVVGIEEEGRDA